MVAFCAKLNEYPIETVLCRSILKLDKERLLIFYCLRGLSSQKSLLSTLPLNQTLNILQEKNKKAFKNPTGSFAVSVARTLQEEETSQPFIAAHRQYSQMEKSTFQTRPEPLKLGGAIVFLKQERTSNEEPWVAVDLSEKKYEEYIRILSKSSRALND